MDGLSLHLPQVIPDSYYDISSHGSGYQPFQTSSPWVTRDDSTRGYHQLQTNDYDSSIRFSSNADRRECTAVGATEGLEPPGSDDRTDEARETGEL